MILDYNELPPVKSTIVFNKNGVWSLPIIPCSFIIEIALSIDNKIDEYFPDYKDVIKDKYENIKGKLAVKYLEFTSTLCEKVGEDACNQAKVLKSSIA